HRARRPGAAHPARLYRKLPYAAGGRDSAVDSAGARRRPCAGRSSTARRPVVAERVSMGFLGSVWQWFSDPAHWTGADGIPQRLVEHVQLSAESVAIGALIALPIGIALGHYGRFGNLAINISNVGRALPSFGILVVAFQVFGL